LHGISSCDSATKQAPPLTAASIVTVEARHAACWAALNQNMDFTEGAFDSGIAQAKVVKAVTPFFVM
jgi:hypothetical protein